MSIEHDPWNRYRFEPGRYDQPIPDAVWQLRDTRVALADHDLRAVYKQLQKHGISQRRIARFTDQSQSEISEIIHGRRLVRSYDLLLRICVGFELPRGWMGLALDTLPDDLT